MPLMAKMAKIFQYNAVFGKNFPVWLNMGWDNQNFIGYDMVILNRATFFNEATNNLCYNKKAFPHVMAGPSAIYSVSTKATPAQPSNKPTGLAE